MSRSGYSDDLDDTALNLWRGAVASAINGKRGQALLVEMLAALEAMPAKELIAHDLERDGQHCALGVVGAARGLPLAEIDPYDIETVARTFAVSNALVQEIAYENDESPGTPAARWHWMRRWVVENIKP